MYGLTRRLRMRWVTPNYLMRVAVADDTDPFTDLDTGDDGLWMCGSWREGQWIDEMASLPAEERKVAEGRILGYALWERNWPSEPEAAKRAKALAGNIWPQNSLLKMAERALIRVMDSYASVVSPDRSMDLRGKTMLQIDCFRQYQMRVEHITKRFDQSTGFIYCMAVMVDPLFQGRGIGARMMRWGLERAEKEKCPILLVASEGGARLYHKLGFQDLGDLVLEGIVYDKVMVYWPKGVTPIEANIVEAVQQESVQTEGAPVVDLTEIVPA